MKWTFDPAVVSPLALTPVLFAIGAKTKRHISRGRQTCFWAGWILTALALVSPLHSWSESLFLAHMTQHELLMVAAAPLLVLSQPSVPLLWSLPPDWRKEVGAISKTPAVRKSWQVVTRRPVAWVLHAGAIWIWHIPRFFEAALANGWIHASQHLSFFGTALLFWWSLFSAHDRQNSGAGILYVFTTALHTSLLGVLLTFARAPWYPAYTVTTAALGMTPIEDQQVGGLIMWIPGGVLYLVIGLMLMARWLREADLPASGRTCAA